MEDSSVTRAIKAADSGSSPRYKHTEESTYVFSMSSRGQVMGEGTGIPAALGAILMATGEVKEKGVCPPEACVKLMDVTELARTKVSIGDKKGFPIVIEHIDKNGKVEQLDLLA